MDVLRFGVVMALLYPESLAVLFCAQPHDRRYYCHWAGQDYANVCPQMGPKRCKERGELICICQDGYWRRRYDRQCGRWRDCAKREIKHLLLVCVRETLYLVGASESIVDPKKFKCFNSTITEMYGKGCIRNFNFLEKTGAKSVTKKNEETTWSRRNYTLYLKPVMWRRQITIQLNAMGSEYLPYYVEHYYPILHANSKCIITGLLPPDQQKTDCTYWVTENDITKRNADCDWIFQNYCNSPNIIFNSTRLADCNFRIPPK
ncbi:uncharacterized protein LOC119402285 [Rhipicephalus sanguineus]|uniref:uncharacterized protein LOC119402285 n=1 Tax=Rhipicephalus sanguineus TaxID=34632 RepID=UPI001892E284|nr:uncharacterized protein LOC119402285 [Rhipicephalus sanguineus]